MKMRNPIWKRKESRRKDMKKSKKKFIMFAIFKRFANGKYEKRKCWTSSEE